MISKILNKKNIPLFIILLITLILEIFAFNWRYFDGMRYKSRELTDFETGEGVWTVSENRIKIVDNKDRYIEFKDINTDIDNIYLNIKDIRCDDEKLKNITGTVRDFQKLEVQISITDKSNAEYLRLPVVPIVEQAEQTKYIKLHTAGQTEKIKIDFLNSNNQIIQLNSIVINKQAPFGFNFIRVLLVFGFLCFLYSLRPNSPLYKKRIKEGKLTLKQMIFALVVVVANVVFMFVFTYTNPKWINPNISQHKEYFELAKSFTKGQLYLDFEPPQALVDMENPYDTHLRSKIMSENNTYAKWDHAYYKGKYYVYFGVLPVLVYYLPCYVLTGMEFCTIFGVTLNCGITAFFLLLLMTEVVKRKFKDIPYVIFMAVYEALVLSSGMYTLLRKPDIYAMPISMAVMLTVAGLYFWFMASEKIKEDEKGINICLALGSLCMALVAACRPQQLAASFLALPLFWSAVFKERKLFSRKNVLGSVLFVLPYVIVAGGLMYYNSARFGSPFDFGANYNLTTNDMTTRGFELGRLPLGIFAYFFQLPYTYPKFPYIMPTDLSNLYMGTTISEPILGGLFTCFPITWAVFILKVNKKTLKEKGLYVFSLLSCFLALVVACADTQMAGILYRYFADFSLLILIPAVISIFEITERFQGGKFSKTVNFTVIVLIVVTVLFSVASMLVSMDYSHEYANPNLYYRVAYAIQFWL